MISLILLTLISLVVFSACGKTPSERISTSTSAVATEIEGVKATQYSFHTSELYESHFLKHGAEFGNITKEQYLQMANDLINSKSKSVLTKHEDDSDKLFYDVNKNEFLVLSTDGYIRTFFKPDDGLDYYNKQ